ncbi:MAG: hypothetical protein NTU43_10500 [Bacteroidetes bacterium]|nr:hypothetical protein [Bacteroidota bacterium]
MKDEKDHIIITSKHSIGDKFLSIFYSACRIRKKLNIKLGVLDDDRFQNSSRIISNSTYLNFEFTSEYFGSIFNTIYHESFLNKFISYLENYKIIDLGIKYKTTVPDSSGNVAFLYLILDLGDIRMNFMIPAFSEVSLYKSCIEKSFSFAKEYLEAKGKSELKQKIKLAFKVNSGNVIFLNYDEVNCEWIIIDILKKATSDVHNSKKSAIEKRASKPEIYFNNSDLRQYIDFGKKQIINTSFQNYFLTKPNDVALYSSISDKNIELAKTLGKKLFYRNDRLTTFVPQESESDYYDFFEFIVTGIITAYTAIECFVNICIDYDFKFEEQKNGIVHKIYTKSGIEREFSLKEKIKNVLPKSIGVKPPTSEPWWNEFLELEKLRDEVIHSKESKSDYRYSQYLDTKVYKTIDAHKLLIKYYCKALLNRNDAILTKLPYGFGNDQTSPIVLEENSFNDLFNQIHGIDRKNKDNDKIIM